MGSSSGAELGGAEVVGTMDADQVPVVSFRVEETVLGGVEGGTGSEHGPVATAAHAAPQLAHFDPECLPGLNQELIDVMNTKEARRWLHLFTKGLITKDVVTERLGVEISEVFEMWVAVQQDNEAAARNCGELVVGRPSDGNEAGREAAGASASSEVSTVDFDKPTLLLEDVERTRVERAGALEHGGAPCEREEVDERTAIADEAEEGHDGGDEESQHGCGCGGCGGYWNYAWQWVPGSEGH